MKKSELLAPAGDLERLKIALHYGADAVYIGGKNFGLRANAANFSIKEIKEAVILAHKLSKKVYVTVNIIFHNEDTKGLNTYLRQLEDAKVDAIMVSDPLVINRVKKLGLKLPLYLSTQTSTLNYEAVKFWEAKGVKRVVLAREAMREDIIRIKKESNMELECFIHGSMCTSFSGKCVLSNYATNRDSNRGGCAQVCRWVFTPTNNNKPFTMTPKDLNMVPFLQDMIFLGIDSFKIEGRMRSIYYLATVILTYRNLIDKISTNSLTNEYTEYYLNILNRCANRESTPQFYNKTPGVEEQYFNEDREEVSNQDFLGIIIDYSEDSGLATIEQRNYFALGDIVEVFGPNTEAYSFVIDKIYNEKNELLDVARHPQEIVKIAIPTVVQKEDMLRVKMFDI